MNEINKVHGQMKGYMSILMDSYLDGTIQNLRKMFFSSKGMAVRCCLELYD